jgi:hypothetical protein
VQEGQKAGLGACDADEDADADAGVGPLDEGLQTVQACVGTWRTGRKGRERVKKQHSGGS